MSLDCLDQIALMGTLAYFCLATAAGIDICAAIVAIFHRRFTKWLRLLYFSFSLLTFAATFYITSFVAYSSDPNTNIVGWPIPSVIFHRDTAKSPWQDFPLSGWAYPMNFIFYMVIPSIAFIIVALWKRRP